MHSFAVDTPNVRQVAGRVISVGARRSPLSQIQVQEVLQELKQHHPDIAFECCFVETSGDKDLKSSLRELEKTDFFTREIDAMILEGRCRIGIHSAKDLPDPLPKGLALIAVTQGEDPADSLVMREGDALETLPPGACVATSSVRREECVRQLRNDLAFVDIRGTIGQRLEKLDSGAVDAVVIAEAALIRLKLTGRNRLRLSGETVKGQGQLAIVARDGDTSMKALFQCIDRTTAKA